MSRGGHQEYAPSPEKRLPPITQDEVDMAQLDYAKWRRERHAKSLHGSWADKLWGAVQEENTELAEWFEPLLESHYHTDFQEGEILKAALSIMYDLLRRKGVLQNFEAGDFSLAGAMRVLPTSALHIAHNPGAHALLMQDMAKSGRMAIEYEQDYQWVLKRIWELLPDVLDQDLTAYNSDTLGHLRSLVEWGAWVMYGCLRQQLEQRQS